METHRSMAEVISYSLIIMSKHILNYHKRNCLNLGELSDNSGNVNRIKDLQQYNPIYSQFFHLNATNYNSISFNHPNHITNLGQIQEIETGDVKTRSIFIKYSPLLDPIRYMIGKYDIEDNRIRTLPNISSTVENCHDKILNASNASYVDNFFYFLSSVLLNHHHFHNGIDYYGSFLGIQDKFKMNIEDDLEYLTSSSFFLKNIGKLMTLENYDHQEIRGQESRKNRIRISVDNQSVDLEDVEACQEDLAIDRVEVNVTLLNEIDELLCSDCDIFLECDILPENLDEGKESDKDSDDESCSTDNSDINYSTTSEKSDANLENEDSYEEDDCMDYDDDEFCDEGSEREDAIAYINNFPVQLICLEKCIGTLDELFEKDLIDEKNGIAIMFQIIITLLVYQKTFHFTHNDLHTHNIMYVRTSKKFLWYKYENEYYKVPTYGRIFKIIDFGRSMYKFGDKEFCSDSFAPGGDGATQYNCEPFFNVEKPRIDRNFSFDLCRLGCSIYDFLFNEDSPPNKLNMLQSIIKEWVTDDGNRNILYKKNGNERYPGFKLYKMISRTVHAHTPKNQLKNPFFKIFLIKNRFNAKYSEDLLDIDGLPSYVN